MAAGMPATYEKFLGQEAQIVRIMPNTAAMVGEAMTAICRNKPVKAEAFEGAMQLFSGIGRVSRFNTLRYWCQWQQPGLHLFIHRSPG